MRLKYIELAGEKHPMCFSLSAVEQICDEFGSMDGMTNSLASDDVLAKLKATDRVLDIMLSAGRKYCEVMKIDLPAPLPCRPADLIDVTDPSAIQAIFETIKNDNEREVEAKDPKKEEPAREE